MVYEILFLINHDARILAYSVFAVLIDAMTFVGGLSGDTDTRAIDNFVVRIRKYVEEIPSKPRHLLTIRGLGYRFVAEPEE